MQSTVTCKSCGSDIRPGAPFGHCPKCLFALGFVDERPASELVTAASSWRIGDYELLGQIGRGGMGAVYRARQIGLNREVAFKMILPTDSTRPEAIKRFQVEAEAAAKMQHPNIVPIYEIGREGSQHYFTMQLIEGANLNECLARFQLPKGSSINGKTEARQAQIRIARLLCTIARAVHFAHQRGVLHRDLKPQNILITPSGEPFLTDFGLAKILDDDESITERMALLGTLNYMAPEQAAGVRVGRAADVFSLGAILYELLTAAPPFRGVTPAETLRFIAEKEPIHPQMFNKWIEMDLAVICLKCLQKNPHERYVSAGELADDLDRWLRDESVLARPVSRPVRARRWVRRNRALSCLVASLVAVVALGTWNAFEWWRGREAQKDFALTLQRRFDDMVAGLIDKIPLSSAEIAAVTGKRITPDPNARRLRVGIYTETDQVGAIEQFAPFLRKIEKEMSSQLSDGAQVEMYLYIKRETLETAFLKGLIDVVRIGEGPLVRLWRIEPGIAPLVEQVSGGKTSVIFVAASSPIISMEQLKGTRFAAGNRTGTSSGYRLLEELLKVGLHDGNDRNIDIQFRESSEENPVLVLEKQFDAGVTRKDKIRGSLTNHFRVLTEFPTTTMPWAARANLDPVIKRAFTTVLIRIKDRRILENVPDYPTQGFKVMDLLRVEQLDHQIRAIEEQFFGPVEKSGAPREQ
jgi:ABC-type phosphate/phosphonate transport system substrate-binding protein/predicted Ser/Thr protein kinase